MTPCSQIASEILYIVKFLIHLEESAKIVCSKIAFFVKFKFLNPPSHKRSIYYIEFIVLRN